MFDELGDLFSELFFPLLDFFKFRLLQKLTFLWKSWDFGVDLYSVGIKNIFTLVLFLFLLFSLLVLLYALGNEILLTGSVAGCST